MPRVTVLSYHEDIDVADAIAGALGDLRVGSRVIALCDHPELVPIFAKEINASELAIAIIDKKGDISPFVSFCIGRGARLIVVSNGKTHLHALFKDLPHVNVDDSHYLSLLMRLVCDILSIESREHATPEKAEDFLTWLSEDATRVSTLSARDFERLVGLILTQMGFATAFRDKGPKSSHVFRKSDESVKAFVQCELLHGKKSVGLKEVRAAVAGAMARDCQFVFFASNVGLSDAASKYVKTCVPPVWSLAPAEFAFFLNRKGSLAQRKATMSFESIEAVSAWPVFFEPELPRVQLSSLYLWPQLLHRVPTSQNTAEHRIKDICAVSIGAAHGSVSLVIEKQLRSLAELMGANLHHNFDDWQYGYQCKELDDLNTAASRAKAILIVDCGQGDRSRRDMTLLGLIADIFERDSHGKLVFVIGPDAIENKLRLPTCLSHSVFVNSNATTWALDIVKYWDNLGDLIFSHLKKTTSLE